MRSRAGPKRWSCDELGSYSLEHRPHLSNVPGDPLLLVSTTRYTSGYASGHATEPYVVKTIKWTSSPKEGC